MACGYFCLDGNVLSNAMQCVTKAKKPLIFQLKAFSFTWVAGVGLESSVRIIEVI